MHLSRQSKQQQAQLNAAQHWWGHRQCKSRLVHPYFCSAPWIFTSNAVLKFELFMEEQSRFFHISWVIQNMSVISDESSAVLRIPNQGIDIMQIQTHMHILSTCVTLSRPRRFESQHRARPRLPNRWAPGTHIINISKTKPKRQISRLDDVL